MHIAKEDLKLDHLYLVYPGDITWSLADNITALGFEDILSISKTD